MANRNSTKLVEMLCENPQLTQRWYSADRNNILKYGVRRGSIFLVNLFIKSGPLDYLDVNEAVRNGHLEVISKILDKGLLLTMWLPMALETAMQCAYTQIVKTLLKEYSIDLKWPNFIPRLYHVVVLEWANAQMQYYNQVPIRVYMVVRSVLSDPGSPALAWIQTGLHPWIQTMLVHDRTVSSLVKSSCHQSLHSVQKAARRNKKPAKPRYL
jgi:hypothetical protein